MSFGDLLNTTCGIERATIQGTDGGGQPIYSWTGIASNVRCRLDPKSGKELAAGRQPVIATHTLFLEPRDVTEKDRIVVGGRTYNVVLVKDAAGHGHHLELDLEVVKG